ELNVGLEREGEPVLHVAAEGRIAIGAYDDQGLTVRKLACRRWRHLPLAVVVHERLGASQRGQNEKSRCGMSRCLRSLHFLGSFQTTGIASAFKSPTTFLDRVKP